MVQRKVPNKLLIKASSPSLKTEKNPSSTIKTSTHNHDNNAKQTELPKKMNKSRFFKRSSDRDTLKNPPLRRLQWSYHPQNQLPCSFIQQSTPASSSSPNYMKSTKCSEARKEKKLISSALLKPPSRPLNRSFSLKRVKIITKAPSFKSSRCTKSVNRSSTATCSSTLKDGKFPPFLDLNPGGTESQGASVAKVCPYNHCSLNGHKHDSNPPLKRFLLSRRKVLREQRNMKSVSLSPCEKMPCEDDGEAKEDVGVDLVVDNESGEDVTTLLFDEEKAYFFIEIYVKEGEDKAKGVEEKESTLIEMDVGKTCSEEELAGEDEMMNQCEYDDGGNFDWENVTSITTLDELFVECSDVDLEEKRRLYLTGLEIEDGISKPSDQESDSTSVHPSRDEILCSLDKESVEKDDVSIAFLTKFLAEDSDEFSRDEITDCYVQFSDSESSMNDVYEAEEFEQYYGCSDIERAEDEIVEDEIVKDSPKNDGQTKSGAKIGEESSINEVVNDLENESEETPEEQPPSFGDSTSLGIGQEHENTPLIDIENSGFTMQASSPDYEETGDPNTKKLSPEQGNHEEISSCKTTIRSRKQGESLEALKSFNPREPNYLEVEADAEAEKVDLRHQEMEERRNAEEWMLDYALRKAVDQLAPQRKTKVSLLVEAFQKVIPEARVRPISSASQACI